MNLLKFVRLHKGLTAARYDWEHCFDVTIVREIAGKEFFLPGDKIERVVDVYRPGQFCRVDAESLSFWNDDYVEDIRMFERESDLTPLRLSLKYFAQQVARALNLPVRGVSVPDESSGLATLRRVGLPIYLSLAKTILELQRHIYELGSTESNIFLLTLLDFSKCMKSIISSRNVKIELLSEYVDEDSDTGMTLSACEGVNLDDLLTSPLYRPQKSGHAILSRPANANYRNLHIKLYTKDGTQTVLPKDDELEMWYDSQVKTKRAVRDITEFVQGKTRDYNVYWELLRLYLIGGGHLHEQNKKKRHTFSQRQTGLQKILASLVDMPSDAKPFVKAGKYEKKTVFSASCSLISPSVRINRYNRADVDIDCL